MHFLAYPRSVLDWAFLTQCKAWQVQQVCMKPSPIDLQVNPLLYPGLSVRIVLDRLHVKLLFEGFGENHVCTTALFEAEIANRLGSNE